jgi:hypothetical protein
MVAFNNEDVVVRARDNGARMSDAESITRLKYYYAGF